MTRHLSDELTVAESRVFASTGKLPARLSSATPPTPSSTVPSKLEVAEESKMHTLACQELNRREIAYLHARMNKRSTLPVGWPDLTIFLPGGVTWLCELKTAVGRLRPEQETYIARLTFLGFRVSVPRSFDEFLVELKSLLIGNSEPQ